MPPPGQQEKRGARGHLCAPLQSPTPLTHRLLPVDCCLGVFWSFLDLEEGEAAVFSSPTLPNNAILDPDVRGHLHDPLNVPDGPRTSPSVGWLLFDHFSILSMTSERGAAV